MIYYGFTVKLGTNEFTYWYSTENNRDSSARSFERYPGTYKVSKFTSNG